MSFDGFQKIAQNPVSPFNNPDQMTLLAEFLCTKSSDLTRATILSFHLQRTICRNVHVPIMANLWFLTNGQSKVQQHLVGNQWAMEFISDVCFFFFVKKQRTNILGVEGNI